ncbi:carboxypeptidase-like regulatory domain-containing protein [Rubinisphaera margarita]|uniref:carboxypeptidase-like regulatory domain-containing protein n=1 Tax=Rubinisphaera margarita TaxID=2909586 RepID=UPI001EE7AFA1|nr:carboxypeptidase-like regulatory domain-containing protein [Rubinisphaera margarita]MCG6157359.1 carboxypeptidase-like regulatory domain-containing protein [Rubinisphaera margarita]
MRYSVFSLCLATLLFTAGCGDSRPSTVPVTGLVTLDGTPVADASVTFYPDSGRPATGRTDAEGIYTLTTFETGDGAVPGEHRVSISKQTIPESNSTEDLEAIKSEIPAVYNNAETSGLKAEVVAGQDAPIDFNLAE